MRNAIGIRPRRFRGPLLVAGLIVLAAPLAAPPLRDAATLLPVPSATLHHPIGYLAGAPLFGVWDALSLLTTSQHYAVVGTFWVVYAAWRLLAGHRRRRSRRREEVADAGAGSARTTLFRTAARETLLALAALAALLAFYAAAALVPRPMAAIRLNDPDLVAVDFHSHTSHSHDAWALFTPARNRAWHQGGGFDAAYVTDHYTWAGVDEALPTNPARAGERTVLLSGMEVRLRNRHVNILGDQARYDFALDSTWHHLDPAVFAAAHAAPDTFVRQAPAEASSPESEALADVLASAPPAIVYALPGPLAQIVPFEASAAGVIAVELIDGSPRGLEQMHRERDRIVAVADSMNLALVAGTNNHGWGSTVPGWTVMRIPGWHEMGPDALGAAIESALHRERRGAAVAVERTMPYHHGSAVRLAATAPLLLWSHLRALTPWQRASWLIWCAVWAAVRGIRIRRRAGVRAGP